MKRILTVVLTMTAFVIVAASAARFSSAKFENRSVDEVGESAALPPQTLTTRAESDQKRAISNKKEKLLSGSEICETIIFTSERSNGKNDIVIMKPDGSGKVGLLPENLDGEGVAVSPDGTKIAFFSHVADVDYKLFVMNTDGSGLLELTEKHIDNREAAFSPDGTKILFQPSHVENEYQDIFIVNVDGTELTNLTPVPNIQYNPVFSPDGSKIVFNRRTDLFGQFTGHRLFSMNVNGTNVTQLTTDTADYTHSELDFSPDGSKIVFISEKFADDFFTIEIINANGSERTRLTEGSDLIFFPHFSPDSGKILFQRLVNGFSEVFLINADGTNLTNLTNHPSRDFHADFNLDGSKILFASDRNGSPQNPVSNVYSINLDGTNLVNLTDQYGTKNFSPEAVFFDSDRDGIGEACDNCRTNANADQADNDADGLGDVCDLDDDNDDVSDTADNCSLVANPSQLNTDGDAEGNACDADDDNDGVLDSGDNCPLTVNQYRFAFSTAAFTPANPEIYIQNFDGSGRTRLTVSSTNDLYPSFNRAGTQIVWESNRSNSRYEIYKMNANGTGTVRLTNIAGNNQSPTFNPDGSKIAFDSTRTGRRNVFIMNSDGSNQTQLTFLTASLNFASYPSFNQDGTRIAFESQRGSISNASWDIYSIKTDGTDEVRLTTSPGRDLVPSYSPDGSKIVFVSQRDGESLGGEIYIMNADGSNQTRLTNNTITETEPTFTPDGSRIMYVSSAGVIIMGLDGQNATLVTGSGGSHPSFAPQADSDDDGVGDACDSSFDINTPTGANVGVQTVDATISFSNVSGQGRTSFTSITPNPAAIPTGYSLCSTCPAYDIMTTAAYTPPIKVCLAVPAAITQTDYSNLKLLHGENGVYTDRTTEYTINPGGQRLVCGQVSSLSPFVLATRLSPTAAAVSVSGRVLTTSGRGIPNAQISLTASDGSRRTSRTNSFGYYRFGEIQAGGNYIVKVQHKQHQFSPRVISIVDNLENVDFTVSEENNKK